jgi:hypothetical protein
MNEEAMARVGLQRHKKKIVKKLIHKRKNVFIQLSQGKMTSAALDLQ